jgi:hypothetical protein
LEKDPEIKTEEGPEQKTLRGWNVRPFPEDLKRECKSRAAKEGKRDWEWLADYLRKVLPMIDTSGEPNRSATRKAKKR